jgi:hypothetical protein
MQKRNPIKFYILPKIREEGILKSFAQIWGFGVFR